MTCASSTACSTIDECAQRYQLDRDQLVAEIAADKVSAMTFRFTDGEDLTLVPTTGCGFPEWLARV